jgi:hypothetical protein
VGSEWPDGWIPATLREADIPVTDFAYKVLLKWQQSTPMLPYTNNPLGMPAVKGVTGELMQTGYATFATMNLMRQRLAMLLKSPAGHNLHEALAISESYAKAWRAIRALKWPAYITETDWPREVLLVVSDKARQRLETSGHEGNVTTSGTYGNQVALGTQQGISARRTAENVNRLNRVNDAIRLNLGRMI